MWDWNNNYHCLRGTGGREWSRTRFRQSIRASHASSQCRVGGGTSQCCHCLRGWPWHQPGPTSNPPTYPDQLLNTSATGGTLPTSAHDYIHSPGQQPSPMGCSCRVSSSVHKPATADRWPLLLARPVRCNVCGWLLGFDVCGWVLGCDGRSHVGQNEEQASSWYKQAADQGHCESQACTHAANPHTCTHVHTLHTHTTGHIVARWKYEFCSTGMLHVSSTARVSHKISTRHCRCCTHVHECGCVSVRVGRLASKQRVNLR